MFLSILNTNRNSTRLYNKNNNNKKSNLKMKNEERELVEKNQDYEELLERMNELDSDTEIPIDLKTRINIALNKNIADETFVYI